MLVKIPSEYTEHFVGGLVYVTRWKSPTLLLMNGAENKELADIFEGSRVCIKGGLLRFLKAGIIELEIENGFIDIPDTFADRLNGSARIFTKQKLGIGMH